MLDTNFGHSCLCLSLPRLRCLAVSVTHFDRMEEIELEDIVVEDASSLERLVMHDSKYGPSVRIPGPTKLKMLGEASPHERRLKSDTISVPGG